MHIFDHDAMNTELQIKICHPDFNYARSAAADCFDTVSMLEDLLSMYKLGSDVSMINTSKVGDVSKLTCYTQECMLAAFQASEMSMGAIDICLGEYFLNAKNDKLIHRPTTPRRGKFAMDTDNFLIKKLEDGMVDLGALGKGYAVDTIVAKLREVWDIENAFVSFGASSIYAYGKPDDADVWTISLDDEANVKVPLANAAVGASGTAVQGNHIIDARTCSVPQNLPFRTWAFGANAAITDAMSTAFMLLNEPQIIAICNEYNMSAAIQLHPNSNINIIE